MLDSDEDEDDAPPPAKKKLVEVVTLESDSDDDLPDFDQLVRDIKPKVDVKPKLPYVLLLSFTFLHH